MRLYDAAVLLAGPPPTSGAAVASQKLAVRANAFCVPNHRGRKWQRANGQQAPYSANNHVGL